MTNKKNIQTPFGVLDFTPSEATQLNSLAERVEAVFDTAGYAPVKTPTIEYFSSLEKSLGDTLKKHSVKFFNDAGDLLMLRPDNTTPVARLVANRLPDGPFPLKLRYSDPIFRRESDASQKAETFQAGVERIGENSPEADAEIIALCVEALKALGLTEFGIDIGHIDFLKSLNDTQKEALLDGDFLAVGHIPERGDANIIQDHSHLQKVAQILEEKGLSQYVSYNKGLVKEIFYYTGLIFEAYVPGVREIVCSGGRYDQLLSGFGLDQPAVGFAINLSALQEGL